MKRNLCRFYVFYACCAYSVWDEDERDWVARFEHCFESKEE